MAGPARTQGSMRHPNSSLPWVSRPMTICPSRYPFYATKHVQVIPLATSHHPSISATPNDIEHAAISDEDTQPARPSLALPNRRRGNCDGIQGRRSFSQLYVHRTWCLSQTNKALSPFFSQAYDPCAAKIPAPSYPYHCQ